MIIGNLRGNKTNLNRANLLSFVSIFTKLKEGSFAEKIYFLVEISTNVDNLCWLTYRSAKVIPLL